MSVNIQEKAWLMSIKAMLARLGHKGIFIKFDTETKMLHVRLLGQNFSLNFEAVENTFDGK